MSDADGVRRTDVHRHVERIIAEEAGLLGSLEQLLRSEAEVVRGDDVEAIGRIGAARHQCIEALTRLDAERSDACRMLGFGNGRGAFDRLLQWCDPAGALRTRWRANLDGARRCKDLNDRNGAVVTARLNRVSQLLATLRGAPPAATYGPKAAAAAMLGHRDFGCA